MFGFSFPSLLLLISVALMVLGPKKTVALALKAGDFINAAKRQYIKLKNELSFIEDTKDSVIKAYAQSDELISNTNLNDVANKTNSIKSIEFSDDDDTIEYCNDKTSANDKTDTMSQYDDVLKRISSLEQELAILKVQLKEKG